MTEKKYGILAVSESWLNSSVTNAEVEMEEYKLIRLDRSVFIYGDLSKAKSFKIFLGFQILAQVQHKKLKSFLLYASWLSALIRRVASYTQIHTGVLEVTRKF